MNTSASASPAPSAVYDRIGVGYRRVRRPDPRLAALIREGLGGARTVVNVGAGTGSYEPVDAEVVAVDPSQVMLDQHPGARKVLAGAEELPFEDGAFDAAMAVMTVHHWPGLRQGLAELRRVARRQLVFTWDPVHRPELWVVGEYFPEIRAMERARFTPVSEVAEAMGAHTVVPFPIPHDFTDGFQTAYWRRPEMFLDPVVRAASSTFAQLPGSVVGPAVARLRADLESGEWHRRHAELLTRDAVDYGYRLLVAGE
ncbi:MULTISPECIES: class I SAM-dependent methyltransferase [unclassified Streptomyces]|uniref:class I SAM-dependent methyltransferase n=1 Tax=unclassified Streptomyces TaxID=2593676 RepID=UPI00081EBA09|nr:MULTISPECIES: class I SAM-dependent methyltransferase [unclassified Streptomyces]MYR30335.1 methyltransferase domain-containing protein [Streptomyces sp. SID4945]SCD74781.1 Ubiquinone/menaquinone biosynthesis C-methylase UbiE [Streptomyces sp. TverLS-915]SCF49450.1 Ubiquinone/menaquinone biosynthesis C-methylase UbiE [Streptomyces sp. LcepLS]